jgi:hypothetical protein
MPKIGDFRGHPVVDRSGTKLGTLDDYYKDDLTGRPLWLKVKARWLRRTYFIALKGAKPNGNRIVVGYDAEVVRHAPVVAHEGPLSPTEDALLDGYYRKSAPTPAAHDGHDKLGHHERPA